MDKNPTTYFISDPHFGHKNLLAWTSTFRGDCKTMGQHDEWLISQINSVVRKRDNLYILGDLCWTRSELTILGELNGNKNFILGNHDKFDVEEYSKYGRVRPGIMAYKGYWLSHAPIHPDELRGRPNIHGHVHTHTVRNTYGEIDKRYVNVCVEALNGIPIDIRSISK